MKRFALVLALVIAAVPCSSSRAQGADFPELSSILALFSAHALPTGGVRVNWTLEQSSPLITQFRVYRGYEDVGNFTVLSDVPVHAAGDGLEYSFADTSARAGVSYYYKLAALGQAKESVFPVVISATPRGSDDMANIENTPLMILPGAKVSLYVRRAGHVKLDIVSGEHKPLVDDSLRPGIYEFDSPVGNNPVTLRMRHENGYEAEVAWPVR